MILDLKNARRCNSIVRQIAYLERKASTKFLRVEHVVDDGAAVARYHGVVLVTAIDPRSSWVVGCDGPEPDVVGAVVHEFDHVGGGDEREETEEDEQKDVNGLHGGLVVGWR